MITIKTKAYMLFIGIALSLFFLLGSITNLIPNPFFIRMSQTHWYDYLFLTLTSILSGMYAGIWYYKKKTKDVCSYMAAGGMMGGVFSFGCAICNKLLVLILGFSSVMTYFMPFQPLLGVVSVSLLTYGVYQQAKL